MLSQGSGGSRHKRGSGNAHELAKAFVCAGGHCRAWPLRRLRVHFFQVPNLRQQLARKSWHRKDGGQLAGPERSCVFDAFGARVVFFWGTRAAKATAQKCRASAFAD